MKKFIKIILFNIFIAAILLSLIEYKVYKEEILKRTYFNAQTKFLYAYKANVKKNFFITYEKIKNNLCNEIETGFRTPTHNKIKYTNNRSILLFGCSYTYGAWLKDNETFSYKLSEYTKRQVFNRAFSGWGISHMLFQLEEDDFNFGRDNIEYVIYTFIGDHIRRLYIPCDYFDDKFIFYKYGKHSSLTQQNNYNYLYWHSYITRKLYRDYIIKTKSDIYDEKTQMFLFTHFLESKKLIKKIFPNANFVIFVYNGNEYIEAIQKELESSGINIIYLNKLSNIDFNLNKYKVDEAGHPSKYAWEIIVPLLAQELKL